MSRTISSSSSRSQVKKPRLPKKKKLCEDGMNCKFMHEHQHILEYDHEEVEKFKAFEGKGRKLGGKKASVPFSAVSRTDTTSTAASAGRILGGTRSRDQVINLLSPISTASNTERTRILPDEGALEKAIKASLNDF